jgi:hypothetical protein
MPPTHTNGNTNGHINNGNNGIGNGNGHIVDSNKYNNGESQVAIVSREPRGAPFWQQFYYVIYVH